MDNSLQMEAVVQTLSNPVVANELARRLNPSSGSAHDNLRGVIKKAGLVIMSETTFRKMDFRWSRATHWHKYDSDMSKKYRMKLTKVYKEIGRAPNGAVDRRDFENEVAQNWHSVNSGVQDDHLRPRQKFYGHGRDSAHRQFYEGSVLAIEKGAKLAKESYGRSDDQIEAMPELFLLRIDWAEGEDPSGVDSDDDEF